MSGGSKQGPYSECDSRPHVNSVSVVVTIRVHVTGFNDCGWVINQDSGYSS